MTSRDVTSTGHRVQGLRLRAQRTRAGRRDGRLRGRCGGARRGGRLLRDAGTASRRVATDRTAAPVPPGWARRLRGRGSDARVQRFRQGRVCEEDRDQGKAGRPHPPVRGEHVIALEGGQHVSQARHRLAHPEPEEREGDLGQDVLRDEQRALGQEQAEGLGRDVPADQVEVARAEPAGRTHVVALPRAQHEAAHEARRPRPVHEADDEHEHQERLVRGEVERQGRAHREEEVEPGQGEEDVGRPHHDGVRPPAVEPRHRTQTHCAYHHLVPQCTRGAHLYPGNYPRRLLSTLLLKHREPVRLPRCLIL
jgi:hypothetical protein